MAVNVMKIGIISKENYVRRTIAVAKGKYKPRHDEPKIWFETLKSMAQILSSENQDLMKLIIDHKPRSLAELERISHRKKSNLSRTLKTLERYGIVELRMINGRLIPKVIAADFKVEFGLHYREPTGSI